MKILVVSAAKSTWVCMSLCIIFVHPRPTYHYVVLVSNGGQGIECRGDCGEGATEDTRDKETRESRHHSHCLNNIQRQQLKGERTISGHVVRITAKVSHSHHSSCN